MGDGVGRWERTAYEQEYTAAYAIEPSGDSAGRYRRSRVVADIKREGLVTAFGISVNRWEPWNGLETLRGGTIDAVQVIYNIFDQAPEDELFPLCRELGIARVPLDEGSLTGALTKSSAWPEADWRSKYLTAENLLPTVERVERRIANVRANVASERAGALGSGVRERLARHRWDRKPTAWSF